MTQAPFKKGDTVVYPLHGIGKIEKIETKKINGEDIDYYLITMANNDMQIRIPIQNLSNIGIRPLVKKKEIKKIFDFLKKEPDSIEDDWKKRYQNNTDKLKEGSIEMVASVVKELYIRNNLKSLSSMEKKQYESAFSILADEVALSGNYVRDEVKNIISGNLDTLLPEEEPPVEKKPKKTAKTKKSK